MTGFQSDCTRILAVGRTVGAVVNERSRDGSFLSFRVRRCLELEYALALQIPAPPKPFHGGAPGCSYLVYPGFIQGGQHDLQSSLSPRRTGWRHPRAIALGSTALALCDHSLYGIHRQCAVRSGHTAPADALTTEMRGDIFMARKMYREAIDAYRKGDPNSAVLNNKIGIAFHQMLQWDQAKKSYERADQSSTRRTPRPSTISVPSSTLKRVIAARWVITSARSEFDAEFCLHHGQSGIGLLLPSRV